MADHPGRRVEVVDSRSACGGLGLIVLAGAAAARRRDIDAMLARVVEAQRTTRIWFAIDTLDTPIAAGASAAPRRGLGGALKIKPILTVDGPITPVERVRTSGRAFERMVGYMHERKADGADAWAVQHIQAPEQAQKLADRGRGDLRLEPQLVSEIGAVIGAHVGPGLLGVVPASRQRCSTRSGRATCASFPHSEKSGATSQPCRLRSNRTAGWVTGTP
jgi:DegV family protein with EDD domain